MTNYLIELNSVYKIYNSGETAVHAIDGISMSIESGEFAAIVGHSGSGKSTLMNILGCLDMPDSGSYTLDGHIVSELSDDRLSQIRNEEIGFVFQGFNLISSMNAAENVELPLLYRGIHRDLRRKSALEALRRVGLEGRLYHRPSQMSGGQQQRVAIARAIVTKPSIILADEPTGNLDSQSGKEVMQILRELHDSGKTIILITHDDEIAQQAKRIIRIHDGKIVQDEVSSVRNFTA